MPHFRRPRARALLARSVLGATVLVLLGVSISAQTAGTVLGHQKLSNTQGGLTQDVAWRFGSAITSLGDLDGNGTLDLAVGSREQFGTTGTVWILFRNPDGTLSNQVEISEGVNGFTGDLDVGDEFGGALAALDDLDGDGVVDLAVGAQGDDDGLGTQTGAVWILFLNVDGTVKAQTKLSQTAGGVVPPPQSSSRFGASLATAGDWNGDGITDLFVGATWENAVVGNEGAVAILFLQSDGTPSAARKIGPLDGGFQGSLDAWDQFGSALSFPGDLDHDGVVDLAVGAAGDDDGGSNAGAVWVLFLNADLTVGAEQKLSELAGQFPGGLSIDDRFGSSLAAPGDVDGDGTPDLAVGAPGDDDGGAERGAAWVLFPRADGSVRAHQKISSTAGNFSGPLDDEDELGSGLAAAGDLDGNGVTDLLVGAGGDGDNNFGLTSSGFGAVWQLIIATSSGPFAAHYGCGANPQGTLLVLSEPSVGGALVFGVDNLVGTQAAGAFAFVALSLAPDPGFPCGTPLPGTSMFAAGAAGELLLGLAPGDFLLLVPGPVWAGPGLPALVKIPVPANPALSGVAVYAQGVLFDPVAASGVELGLTSAAKLLLGP